MKTRIQTSLLVGLAAMMLMLAGPASAQGWGYHPGWHRYHVYRNHAWGYVWHPAGWVVPTVWVGPPVHHWRHHRWRHRWH